MGTIRFKKLTNNHYEFRLNAIMSSKMIPKISWQEPFLKSPFLKLADWFSYKGVQNNRDDVCKWIIFCECELKREIAQFKIGTQFNQIKLNEYGVVEFDIYHSTHPDSSNYSYTGNWILLINNEVYTSIAGYTGICYIKANNFTTMCNLIRVTSTGFKISPCISHERTPLIQDGVVIQELELDMVNNHIYLDDYVFDLEIKFILNPESIKTTYLDSELEKGHIDQHKYDETIRERGRGGWERGRGGWDVRLPNS